MNIRIELYIYIHSDTVNSTAHYFIPRGNCACVLSMDLGVKGSVLTEF